MLVVSGANTLGGLGAPMSELTALKQRVEQCIRSFPIVGNDDNAASTVVTCDEQVGGTKGIKTFEKQTLLEDVDNALLFSIAQSILTGWRNTGMGARVSPTEVNVRRIAALKLGEQPVFDSVSPTLAAQALASAGRIEPNDTVKGYIAVSLYNLLKNRDIPASVRTEAMTTLKLFADPQLQRDVTLLNVATSALKALELGLEIGPITITPTPSPISKYKIPLIAAGVTAVVATTALGLFFHHRHATGLAGPGPLRRQAEAALRRRRAR